MTDSLESLTERVDKLETHLIRLLTTYSDTQNIMLKLITRLIDVESKVKCLE